MTDPLPNLPVVEEPVAPDNVIHLAAFMPPKQLPLNDRELIFLRALIANHADLMGVLLSTRERLDKIVTGCPIARRALLEP